MKPIVFLLALVLFVAIVRGRNLHDSYPENNDSEDGKQEKHLHDQTRHRRRPRQSYYNHFNPYNLYDDYFGRRDDRRSYSRQQEELLSRILDQIDELSIYIKKTQAPPPPPPPQIIYVPIPYPVPQCQNLSVPDLDNRFNPTDRNQIWGIVPGNLGQDDFGILGGSRPINLSPVKPEGSTVKPPPVEHGSNQAGMTTAAPTVSEPGRCKAAILVCCQDTSEPEKQECFSNYGCLKTYSVARACHPAVVKRVIAEFAEVYAPINDT